MNIFHIENDIPVFCVSATSFPAGIQEAFKKLHAAAPRGNGRKFYGISRPDAAGGIHYKAAATELTTGELNNAGLESFTIKQGDFLCVDVNNFMQNTPAIGAAFTEILKDTRIDPQGYCLEWYVDDNLCKCLVPIK